MKVNITLPDNHVKQYHWRTTLPMLVMDQDVDSSMSLFSLCDEFAKYPCFQLSSPSQNPQLMQVYTYAHVFTLPTLGT